jgi:hypothetical protein
MVILATWLHTKQGRTVDEHLPKLIQAFKKIKELMPDDVEPPAVP